MRRDGMKMSDPKSNNLRFAFALTAVLCILIFSISSCTTKPGPANTSAKENLAVLEDLGIKTDLGDLKDPNGNPLPADYNPLGKKYGVFNPTDEIYTAGYTVQVPTEFPPYTMDVHQCLFDYGGMKKLHYSGYDSWASSQFKNCIGADVDGDGFEEVVVVYYDTSAQTLNLKVIDNQDGHYDEYNKVIVTGITSTPSLSQYQPALAKGDFDKDNKDEIAVGFTNWVYVLDDKDSDYAVTSSHNYPNTSDLYLAAGDVDWDSQDELVVTYHYGGYAYCDLFDGDLSAPLLINQVVLGNLFDNNMNIQYEQHVHVCVGDIDGDRYKEVVLYGECRNYSPGWVVTAMKYNPDTPDFEWMDFYFFTQRSDAAGTSSQPTLAILDYNGDGLEEIFASSNVYKIDPSANTTDFLYHSKVQYGIYTNPPVNVWTGDVDGDFKDELLCYQGYPSSGNLRIDGWDEVTSGNVTQLTRPGSCDNTSKICLANVDNDSPIVEYTGQHELLFSYPTVIAVLACPPYHAGIGQNIGSCGTTFGMSTATGVEKTESTGFTVGFSVGYESEDPFGIAKSSFKVKVESAMDWISSKSNEIEKYVAYTSGPDEDKVIFTAIPFDVYYYTVISSPNPADVGNTLSINVPRDMQTLSVSRIFYNDRNGDNPNIDSQVLGHTIGDVWSYPSAAERNALLVNGGLCSSNLMTVGVGSGYVTQGIRMSQGQGTGTYNNFSVTVESEFGIGGVTFGMSAGFNYGFEYKVTNTQSTFYEGKVGDIPYGSYSTGMSYSFCLFTYPFTFNKQTFTVVNYWVQ
jgi:hypothetical protein